jgi:hypothetical protein
MVGMGVDVLEQLSEIKEVAINVNKKKIVAIFLILLFPSLTKS